MLASLKKNIPGIPQSLVLRMMRIASLLVALVTVAVGLSCGLVVLQSQRDEARRADAVLLSFTSPPPPEHLNHVFELYRRGYAPRLILAGTNAEAVRSTLIKQGLPGEALLTAEGQESKLANLRSAAELARQQGFQSVVLTDNPTDLLLSLKITHDFGIKAYGSPARAADPELGTVLRSGLAYWGYVILGRG